PTKVGAAGPAGANSKTPLAWRHLTGQTSCFAWRSTRLSYLRQLRQTIGRDEEDRVVARRGGHQQRAGARARWGLVEEKVKSAAAHVFLQRGIANASLGDVAEELGTARTALYHYFKSKDELLVALISECAAEARQILAEAGGDSPPERLWEAVRRL